MVKAIWADCNKKMDYLAAFSMYNGLRSLLCSHKAILLQPWTGAGGSRSLRLPDFKTIWQKKTVNLSTLRTGRLYPSVNIPGTHFC